MGILKHYGQKWAGLEMLDKLIITFNDKINTPADTYDPNKIDESDLEKFQRERDSDIKLN